LQTTASYSLIADSVEIHRFTGFRCLDTEKVSLQILGAYRNSVNDRTIYLEGSRGTSPPPIWSCVRTVGFASEILLLEGY
jgi:hypothetical protein